MHVVLLSSYEDHTSRLNGCHSLPRGVTVLLSVLSSFRLGKIIAVYSDNNSKHLNNTKP
jgi:hypothetical protein